MEIPGEESYSVPDDTFGSGNLIFANDHLFYKTAGGLSVVVFSLDDGSVKSEQVLEKNETSAFVDTHIFEAIATNDRSGVVFGDRGSFTIYLENEWRKPVKLEDANDSLYAQLASGFTPILTTKRDRIIFTSGLGGNKVYSLKQKDMIYDEKGQDKIFRFGKSFSARYVGGKFISIESSNTVINVYDENFKLINTVKFKPSEQYLDTSLMTIAKDKIHVWNFNDYKRSNSLKLITFDIAK